jgi:hypothetical protein
MLSGVVIAVVMNEEQYLFVVAVRGGGLQELILTEYSRVSGS